MVQDYVKFKGITKLGTDLLSNQLETNIKSFLDWSFLEIGGFNNVSIPTSGLFGGTYSTLRLVNDESYTLGQVWETVKKDWVWETGISYTGATPYALSGIKINGTFYGTGDATYSHHYNYPLGRVIFNSAIDNNATVALQYSYRSVQTYIANEVPWWQEVQYRSFRPDDSHFAILNSGDWSVGSEHRIQLPAIIIETVPRMDSEAHELGNGAFRQHRSLIFNVIAENSWDRNQIMDILVNQKQRVIHLFDTNLVVASGQYPLDYRGMYVGGTMYPSLVDNYHYKKAYIDDCQGVEVQSPYQNLHEGKVRMGLEVISANL